MGILNYPAYIIAFELQYSVGEGTSMLAGIFLVILKLHSFFNVIHVDVDKSLFNIYFLILKIFS